MPTIAEMRAEVYGDSISHLDLSNAACMGFSIARWGSRWFWIIVQDREADESRQGFADSEEEAAAAARKELGIAPPWRTPKSVAESNRTRPIRKEELAMLTGNLGGLWAFNIADVHSGSRQRRQEESEALQEEYARRREEKEAAERAQQCEQDALLAGKERARERQRQADRESTAALDEAMRKLFESMEKIYGPQWRTRPLASAPVDCWTTLGVGRTATESEIKAAFRKLVFEHHPDRGGDPEQFIVVRKAYEQAMSVIAGA